MAFDGHVNKRIVLLIEKVARHVDILIVDIEACNFKTDWVYKQSVKDGQFLGKGLWIWKICPELNVKIFFLENFLRLL